jgi:hypothetical protein
LAEASLLDHLDEPYFAVVTEEAEQFFPASGGLELGSSSTSLNSRFVAG